MKDSEVELITDGDGLAVLGNPSAVERFMASIGLSSDAESPDMGAAFALGAAVVSAASTIAANAGRWVKLSEESARRIKEFGLTPTTVTASRSASIARGP